MTHAPTGRITPRLLGALFERHAAALALFARQWCDWPEDVVQQAFLSLASQKHMPERPTCWLYTAVRNAAVSASRSAGRRRRREAAVAEAKDPWFIQSYESRLDSEAAVKALRALPAEQREVIVARIWGGLTFEHVGEVTGCSSSAAHRRYRAGMTALRERLGIQCLTNTTTER